MANKFGLGSLPLDTKKPITTAWINKAKPYFVKQIEDTLQGDLDMNNFTITNLKLPENDYDAVHKKYLMDQLNLIEVDKEHLKERIGDVKRYFKRQINNKDFIDDTKLQQEVTSLKSFIEEQLLNVVDKSQLQPLKTKLIGNGEIQKQIVGIKQQQNVVDKTQIQNLKSLISKLDDAIAKRKIDLKQLIDNIKPGMNGDELAALETKLNDNSEIDAIKQQLDNLVDKTQLQPLSSLISKLDDKITKQKIDLKQLIDNIKPGISEDKLTELETKLNDDSEIDAIKQQLLNVVDKTQFQNLKSLISNLDKITKQKIDLKQLIDNIKPGISEHKWQQETTALETKFKTELQKEQTNINQIFMIVRFNIR
ncbi:hypothetical protein LOTGIDRAFT_163682 [Lottia gigantea]|uniref:Uncharacterized protein n=1 Tax=Lottia gigantea TaxID=225164 RepID=V4A282_LOTGI|nr:hypothetical protein LOTGIDRAFT_163682 [Lottia gigantea]ESO90797.1 hypothetical protein LOTGIDRAFT_163682 [Lottia gigantea]